MKVHQCSISVFIVILNLAISGIGCHAQHSANEDSLDSWRSSTPEKQGMDTEYLVRMFEHIDSDHEDIHSVLIVRNGHIVLEAYYYPYHSQIKHMLASATKSFTSALVGIAIDREHIPNVNHSVLDFFPEFEFENNDDLKRSMKLKHLLTMTSGLNWTASWADDDPESLMFQMEDPVQFILDRPMASEPGMVWNYSGGDSHLLSAIIQKMTGEKAIDFAVEHLFKTLKFSNFWWEEHHRSGVSQGCAGLYLRPVDMAKLGYLYLNQGKWNGKTILSPDWINESFKKHTNEDYGYQWWIVPELKLYKAWGYGGQHIAVLPDLDMVVVFTGGIRDAFAYPWHKKIYQDFIVPSVKSSKALRENHKTQEQLIEWINKVASGPEPQPVEELPWMAQNISRKTYEMNPNNFGLRYISLEFRGRDSAFIDLGFRFMDGTFPLGLDGTYRIKTIERRDGFVASIAIRGRWLDDETFGIDLLNIDFGYRYGFICYFKNKKVDIEATAVIENMKEKVVGIQK